MRHANISTMDTKNNSEILEIKNQIKEIMREQEKSQNIDLQITVIKNEQMRMLGSIV